jgi:hypothetical protein
VDTSHFLEDVALLTGQLLEVVAYWVKTIVDIIYISVSS